MDTKGRVINILWLSLTAIWCKFTCALTCVWKKVHYLSKRERHQAPHKNHGHLLYSQHTANKKPQLDPLFPDTLCILT